MKKIPNTITNVLSRNSDRYETSTNIPVICSNYVNQVLGSTPDNISIKVSDFYQKKAYKQQIFRYRNSGLSWIDHTEDYRILYTKAENLILDNLNIPLGKSYLWIKIKAI